jgi:hypothetical protein
MNDNFKNQAKYKIIEIAERKFNQLQTERFELNSLLLSENSQPLFFNQTVPKFVMDEISIYLDIRNDLKAKGLLNVDPNIINVGELENKFVTCKEKISNSLKIIKITVNVLLSKSFSNNRIHLIGNYILQYLITHEFLTDKPNKINSLKTHFRVMPVDLLSLIRAQEKVNQLEDELAFFDLLLNNFTDTSLLELEIDYNLRVRLDYYLGLDFYKYVQKKITESKIFLCPELHFEVDKINKEFSEINDHILQLLCNSI